MKKLLFLILSACLVITKAQLNTRFSVNTGSWKTPNCYQSKLAKDLGAYWAGQDGGAFGWKNCQPAFMGPYNWNVTDSVVGCLQNNGIHLMPTLRCVSPHKPGFSGACETSYTTGAS